jgi:hypothetical protein
MSTSRSHSLLTISRSHSPDQLEVQECAISEFHSPSRSPDRDESLSRSPSPVIGRKWSYSSSEDGLQFVKAQKVSEEGGCPKASDYDDIAKEVILCATAIYRCLVSTSNAFLTPSEKGELIKSGWKRANDETSQDIPIALTPAIAKVVGFISIYSKKDFLAILFRFRLEVVKSEASWNPLLLTM